MLAYSMTDDPTQSPPTKRLRRATRYQKAQERRHKQNASDSKFYAAMFSIMTVLALLVILVGAIMLGGGNVDASGMSRLAQPWIGSVTMLEAIGVAFVGAISGMVYLRMRKR